MKTADLAAALATARRISRSYRIADRSLAPVHLLALLAERGEGGIPIGEAAAALGVSSGAATGIVDALEERGLAERRRESRPCRHRVRVHITAAGTLALSA